jgi:hypothetical protein
LFDKPCIVVGAPDGPGAHALLAQGCSCHASVRKTKPTPLCSWVFNQCLCGALGAGGGGRGGVVALCVDLPAPQGEL